jgi:hypothetical protein
MDAATMHELMEGLCFIVAITIIGVVTVVAIRNM